MNKKVLGDKGENISCEFLKDKGYDIVTRNYRTRYGEIDIIAKDGTVLVFAEVKLRSGGNYGRGIEAVTPHKVGKIHQVAMEYIQHNYETEPECRFDVIEITNLEKIEIMHVKNAF